MTAASFAALKSIMAYRRILPFSSTAGMQLYRAATSIGLGGCAIASVDGPLANRVFGLDGEEETILYAMPVGTVNPDNQEAEDAFYAFVRQEGL